MLEVEKKDEMTELVAYSSLALIVWLLAIIWYTGTKVPFWLFVSGILLITLAPAMVSYQISNVEVGYTGWIERSSISLVFLLYLSLIAIWVARNRDRLSVIVLMAAISLLVILVRQSRTCMLSLIALSLCLFYLFFLIVVSL